MSETETIPTTDEVLVSMLTENTGRHMLDSGGAYGRAWERNQGLTIEALLAKPALEIRMSNDAVDYFSIDVFHFLRACLEYDPETDALFQTFANLPENEREGWMSIMESFPEWLSEQTDEDGDSLYPDFSSESVGTVNTYNNEDALSQTIQYTQFAMEGNEWPYGEFVALQIHGGCDVRGGYTMPRIFRTNDDCALWDNAKIEGHCSPPAPEQDPLFPVEPHTDHWFESTSAGCSFDNSEDYRYTVGGYQAPHDWIVRDGVVYCPKCADNGLESPVAFFALSGMI